MESDETNMPPFIGLARPLSAQAEAMPAQEVIGERCIDGGKCHHRCESKCFRRECCGPLSGYTGPWKYEEMPAQEPVAWRDHVEHRLRSWQYEIMNEAGDRLGLDDFLDADELDSLIDFVCDEHAEPPDQTAAYRVCDCGHAESDHGPGLDSACQLCSCINPVYSPALPAQEPVAKVQNNSGIAWLPAGYNDLSIGPGALLYTAPPDLAARVKELEAVLRDAVTLVSIINQSEIVRSGYSLSLERAFRAALAKEKT